MKGKARPQAISEKADRFFRFEIGSDQYPTAFRRFVSPIQGKAETLLIRGSALFHVSLA
jgi:hypothetical protein